MEKILALILALTIPNFVSFCVLYFNGVEAEVILQGLLGLWLSLSILGFITRNLE